MIAHRLEPTSVQEKDVDLIARAKANPTDFKPIYDKYFDSIFYYMFKRLETQDEAFDLTQDVFIKALKSLDKYEDRGKPFLAWLYRIAFSTLTDFYRKSKRQRVVSITDEYLRELSCEIEESRSLQETGVMSALQKLNEQEMELIQLRYFEEHSFKEIADLMNINVNAAQVRVHRIIKKLRETVHGKV
jgi:RNA polymerase sigma-70 factor (ECF subfamily)